MVQPTPAAPPDTGLHLLVVDDHAVVRLGLVQMIRSLRPGCEVSEAGGLAQALAVLAARPDVALVVLDLHLPDAPPLHALRELRLRHPLLPVVMISADEDPRLAAQALREGASGWLPKAADGAGLAGALELVLQGGCAVPAFLARWERHEPTAPAAEQLTERQNDVLECLTRGLSNKEIARELDLAEPTVKAHLVSIFRVLKVRNRAQAALAARDRLAARAAAAAVAAAPSSSQSGSVW